MPQPDIILLAIDSLRPDHLGCYGYHRSTSPAIDALAAESVLFDRAFAAGIPTMPSFTTLFTGLHPYRHGIVAHMGPRRLAEHTLTLAQLAKQAGYVTIACDNLVIQGEGRGGWFARGFDHYSGFLYQPFSDQSRRLTDRALGWLGEHDERPLLLFMHYWDPHTPYGPRPPFDTMHYTPGSGAYDMAAVRALAPAYYDAFLDDMHLRHPDDYAYVVAQYDGEISQVDAEIGRLLAAVRQRPRWNETVVILLSDHGEAFGEGDFHFDHHGLYDAVTRIALSVRAPGVAPGRRSALVSNEDILPTLAALAELPLPPYPLSGTSLVPLLHTPTAPGRDAVITSESSRQASLALRTAQWKCILPVTADAYGNPLPDFYGRPRSPVPLLFDLRADPGETRNVAEEHREQLTTLLTKLQEWRAAMVHSTGEPDPIQEQGLSLRYDIFMQRLLARRSVMKP
jgi:arylsulfatase A-like enzyme